PRGSIDHTGASSAPGGASGLSLGLGLGPRYPLGVGPAHYGSDATSGSGLEDVVEGGVGADPDPDAERDASVETETNGVGGEHEGLHLHTHSASGLGSGSPDVLIPAPMSPEPEFAGKQPYSVAH